ncbi:hypothetical protein [Nannocystis punicea]|uniref:Lipoprotein n=1 Tax=Nannocystis punicea TaxID=2995304 RepID=A0ABY7HJQ4_9BACT|nr:hypothetical protein [Nannocystis poenicansa]WAS99169.1 hypothetical protein O0S08_23830 [Nannocystis poenicansa]
MNRTTLLLLSGLLACSGCSIFQKLVTKNHEEKYDELEKAGDYEALAAKCAENKSKACEAKTRVGERRLAASTCDELKGNLDKYYSNHQATKESDLVLVRKFAECGQAAVMFGQDLRIRWLDDSMVTLDKEGVDLFGQFVGFIGAGDKAYEGESGVQQANRMARWLVAVNDASRCPTLDAAMPKVAPEARGEFVWFYYEAGCGAQAVPHAQKALLAEQYGFRIQACDVLGKYGDASALEALNTLAETDPYKAEREVRTSSGMVAIEVYYPVRERCQAATGQLRLRKAAG